MRRAVLSAGPSRSGGSHRGGRASRPMALSYFLLQARGQLVLAVALAANLTIRGTWIRAARAFANPSGADVGEEQLRMDLLEDAGGRFRSQVLDIQAMFPFSPDGLDGPATMIEFDQFGPGSHLPAPERGQQPTGAKSAYLISNQSGRELRGQPGPSTPAVGGRTESDHPFMGAEALDPFCQTGDLVGDPHEEMGLAGPDVPEGDVGEQAAVREEKIVRTEHANEVSQADMFGESETEEPKGHAEAGKDGAETHQASLRRPSLTRPLLGPPKEFDELGMDGQIDVRAVGRQDAKKALP